jgi:1-deoxy-D-xylulose-5-phosphate synthase
MILETIQSPDNLSELTYDQMNILAGEIRDELIQTVSKNGGHLASNLGVVELTLALHRVFHAPEDKLIFDVGHQSYVHKLITGRYRQFSTLREYNGISGFPKRNESVYDCFETGHASTAISAALGFARARDYRHETYDVVALVGDGALTGGMCYEALNDAGNQHTRMTVILNDNEMSIAPNVGALSSYLTKLRVSGGWQSAKIRVRHLSELPVIGKKLYRIIHSSKKMLKSVVLKDEEIGFFEALGFQYFGPIDGHDIAGLEKMLKQARECKGPCVIHVLTKKGFGYEQAEKKPEAFHGTPPFYIENGDRISPPGTRSCGHIAADVLAELSEKDSRIVAVTAAMKLGTGMDHFAEKFPDRVIDVGIAEEHAATMCAGMAAGGMKPYFAVYSSFFQRCYDQLIHDICMQNLPVTFLLDRSGIGGEDGQTHHGLFDMSAMLPVPNMKVLAPCDAGELEEMIRWSTSCEGPCAIRYSKYLKKVTPADGCQNAFRFGFWNVVRKGGDGVLLAVGSMVRAAMDTAELLAKKGVSMQVVNCSTVKPLDEGLLEKIGPGLPVFTFEEHMLSGGFGAAVGQYFSRNGRPVTTSFGVSDAFIQHGDHQHLMEDAGLTARQMAETILNKMGRAARG